MYQPQNYATHNQQQGPPLEHLPVKQFGERILTGRGEGRVQFTLEYAHSRECQTGGCNRVLIPQGSEILARHVTSPLF